MAGIGAMYGPIIPETNSIGRRAATTVSVATMVGQLDEQRQLNSQAKLANERLAAEVRDLKEGLDMIEEKARMELGMVKPNEIFVLVSK